MSHRALASLFALGLALGLGSEAFAAGPPPVGPGSPAWTEDLAALEAAIEADAPDVEDRIAAFGKTHHLQVAISRLHRSFGLLPIQADGRSDPDNPVGQRRRYRLAPMAKSSHNVVKYQERLRKLLPKVDADKMTLDKARRKAAGWSSGFWGGQFGGWADLGIADLTTGDAIRVRAPNRFSEDEPHLQMVKGTRWKPDYYMTTRPHRDDLPYGVVLDSQYRIVAIDRDARKEGLRNLAMVLRFTGELAPELPNELIQPAPRQSD